MIDFNKDVGCKAEENKGVNFNFQSVGKEQKNSTGTYFSVGLSDSRAYVSVNPDNESLIQNMNLCFVCE